METLVVFDLGTGNWLCEVLHEDELGIDADLLHVKTVGGNSMILDVRELRLYNKARLLCIWTTKPES